MGWGVKRVEEAEKGRESRGIEASHEHGVRVGRGTERGRGGERTEQEQEGKGEQRGQAAPFIVSQAQLAVAR